MLGKLWKLFMSKRSAKGALGKDWWWSKTLWANGLAIVVLIFQDKLGLTITGEESTYILGVVNMVLRFVSNGPIGFKDF